jgi:hypothetical protein
MSGDPRDYDGVTFESEAREREEQIAIARDEKAEREAREMDFDETTLCTETCCETLVHQTEVCAALASIERAMYFESLRQFPSEGDLIQAWLDGAPDSVLQSRTVETAIAQRRAA